MELIQKKYRILSLEGADLLKHTTPASSLSILNSKGKLNFSLFKGFLDYSLEIEKLRKVYKKHMSGARLSFEVKTNDLEEPVTLALINISFRYSLKDSKTKETLKNRDEIRQELYNNGFYVDGIHYVRYKRSAGSSRNGQCLFIPEPMYEDMMEWSSMGLDPDSISDLTSFEAYISLTLSSVIHTIELKKESLLILRDISSVFTDRVIAIETDEADETEIKATEKDARISNKIWDGEALLDSSVFIQADSNLKGPYFSEKGMALLRNRFFKSCAFNTNLQQFFADNNITIDDLEGFTLAKDIRDIKLVVTESSIKYLKMLGIDSKSSDKEFADGCRKWLKQTENVYGIVKTEKSPHHMGGEMVSANYQIINTLGLTEDETKEFLAPSLTYIGRIIKQAMFMRHYIGLKLNRYDVNDDDSDDELSLLDYNFEVVRRMLEINDDFAGTEYYSTFKNNVRNAFKKKLAMGRVLIDGTYATILGNGIELLYATIGKCFDENGHPVPLALHKGEIYCKRFSDGPLLAARSPHITMGNIFIPENKTSELYDRYFNLTREIVCINAIDFNIQQRLNGCDYDSDTMLITDNSILLDAAKRNYHHFLVPSCLVEEINAVEYHNDADSKFRMDKAICDNKIGEIVNLSQFLNSIYWDNINNGASWEDESQKELYNAICTLAAMSSMEIDKAKRQYKTDANKVLHRLGKYKNDFIEKYSKPEFYVLVTTNKHKTNTSYSIKTAMEYVVKIVYNTQDVHALAEDTEKDKTVFTKYKELIKDFDPAPDTNFTKYVQAIKKLTVETKNNLDKLNRELHKKTCFNKSEIREQEKVLYQKYFDDVSAKIKSDKTLLTIIKYLDSEDKKANEDALKYKRLLLSALVLKCTRFMELVKNNQKAARFELTMCDNGDIDIYGHKHIAILKTT